MSSNLLLVFRSHCQDERRDGGQCLSGHSGGKSELDVRWLDILSSKLGVVIL